MLLYILVNSLHNNVSDVKATSARRADDVFVAVDYELRF